MSESAKLGGAAKRALDEIRRRIAAGLYGAQSLLPAERALAVDLGVSRGTLRGVLKTLTEEGLLASEGRRGARVQAALDRAQRGIIGVVFGAAPSSSVPHYSSEKSLVLDGIQDALLRLRQNYKAIPVESWQRLENVAPLRQCGALVFLEALGREDEILELRREGVPLVVANLEQDLDLPCTRVDHEALGRSEAKVLMAMGHRRIGVMIRDPKRVFYGRFLRGWRVALEEAGLEAGEGNIGVSRDYHDPEEPVNAAREMLRRKPCVTAVACGRDHLAKAVCRAARELGMEIGRDLSVISYDDCSWAEGHGFLTTFREPCRELGAGAVEMLTECLVYGRVPAGQRTLAAPLVLRRSACPAPGADLAPLPGGGEAVLDLRPDMAAP